jgi:pimeloyl-ACP methyl ester carboxylesterase
MRKIVTLLFAVVPFFAMAQFPIGHRTITFNDPARTGGYGSGGGPGRQIQCEIYYPAVSAGENTTTAVGEFPVIVFGHGFVMSWDAYTNVWEKLVPEGYIMVFPRTEGGMSPNHNEFALDLRICVTRMQLEATTSTSPFYQKVSPYSAFMGHSMGGGASVLAASGQTNIETMVGLAPAETNPSAVTAAAGVTVPSLIMSGTADGVTPPADHHIPIFNAVSSSCKSLLNITGGGHCYYANTNFNCDFGEMASAGSITLTREEQQDVSMDMYSIWFDYYLKKNCAAWGEYLDSLQSSTRFTENHVCSVTEVTASGIVTDETGTNNGAINLSVSGGSGNYTFDWSNGMQTEDIAGLSGGTYTVIIQDASGCFLTESFTVQSAPLGWNEYQSELTISVFPNPFTNEITIAGAEKGMYVQLKDASGRICAEKKVLHSGNFNLTVNELSAGIYFLEAGNEKQQYKILKVMKW